MQKTHVSQNLDPLPADSALHASSSMAILDVRTAAEGSTKKALHEQTSYLTPHSSLSSERDTKAREEYLAPNVPKSDRESISRKRKTLGTTPSPGAFTVSALIEPELGDPGVFGKKNTDIGEDTARILLPKQSRTNTSWTPIEEQRLKIMREAGNSWAEIAKVGGSS